MNDSSRVLLLGIALALGTHAAMAGEKPEAKDSPVVRKEVEVRTNEAQVVKTEAQTRKNEAELEAKLEAARERLEEAAREVAELSGQLTGPMMHDSMMQSSRPRAVLGINIGDTDSKEGVAIDSVSPNGAASKAGLKGGDVIVSLDGEKLVGNDVSPARTLIRHMRAVEPGAKVQVEYLRDGKKLKTEVVTQELKWRSFTRPILPVPGVEPMPPMPPMPPAPPAVMEMRSFPGMLDMELITLTPKLGAYFGADRGVLVVRVPKQSELKLEEGDVIVDIDGREPQSGSHALRILRSYQPGEKVSVNVLRNRKKVKLDVTVPKNERMGWAVPLDSRWLEDVTIEFEDAARDAPAIKSPKAPKTERD